MKQIRIFSLIAALVALTFTAHAQLSLEINGGSGLAYTDAPNTNLGSHLGVRLDHTLPLTPTTQLGVYVGAFGHHLSSGSLKTNRAYGELGLRISTGDRLKFFGEAGMSAERQQYRAANIQAAGGISWSTLNNIVLGGKLSAQRNVAQPDGLDGIVSGNSDVIVTPTVFVRIPLKKQKRKQLPPQVQSPAPVYDVAKVRDQLLRDSTFGQTMVKAIQVLSQKEIEPVVQNQMRWDSILLSKVTHLNQRLDAIQTQMSNNEKSPAKQWKSSYGFNCHFGTGDSLLTTNQKAQLSLWLKEHPKTSKIEVIGASSFFGNRGYDNLRLANGRANEVKKFLLVNGYKPDQITVRVRSGLSVNTADQFVNIALTY